jgi:UPF0271 protein
MQIDLNCDLGEGCPHDAELMSLISSANIACGGHAGDAAGIFDTLQLAGQYGLRVGAHPGYPDREHFGRRELDWPTERIYRELLFQIGALVGLARGAGVQVRHVKPHGALYNQAGRDHRFAEPVARAAAIFDLPVMGLPGSELELEARRLGLRFIAEGFADRRYGRDGSLVPRSRRDALLQSPEEAVRQAEWLIRERGVETLCVHGDNPQALAFVRRLREHLVQEGVQIRAFETGTEKAKNAE